MAEIFDVQLQLSDTDRVLAKVAEIESKIDAMAKNSGKALGDGLKDGIDRGSDAMTGLQQSLLRIFEIASGISLANIFSSFVSGTKEAISSSIEMAGNLESIRSSFDILGGGAENAKVALDNLSKFALITPFELPQLQTISKQLLAVGFNTQQLLPILNSLGNISSTPESLNRIAYALGQVKTAGRLMTQDLMQFNNAGVPLLGELEKKFGLTGSAMRKMISDGAVSYQAVQEVLFAMSSKGGRFFGNMIAQSKTFNGTMSNIKDGLGVLSRSIIGIEENGDIIKNGFFEKIKTGAGSAMVAMGNFVALTKGKLDFSEFLRLLGISKQTRSTITSLGNAFKFTFDILSKGAGLIAKAINSPLGAVGIAAFLAVVAFKKISSAISSLTLKFGQLAGGARLGLTKMNVEIQLQSMIAKERLGGIASGARGKIASGIGGLKGVFTRGFRGIFSSVIGIAKGGIAGILGLVKGMVMSVVGFITSPIVLVIGALGALFLAWQTNFLGIRDVVNGAVQWIAGAFKSMAQYLLANMEGIVDGIFNGVNGMIGAFNGFVGFLRRAFLVGVGTVFKKFGGIIKSTLKSVIGGYKNFYGFVLDISQGVVDVFQGKVPDGARNMALGILDAMSGIGGGVARVFDGVVNTIGDAINAVIDMINGLLNNPLAQGGLKLFGLGGVSISRVGTSNFAGAVSGNIAGAKAFLNSKKSNNQLGGAKEQLKGAFEGLENDVDEFDTDKFGEGLLKTEVGDAIEKLGAGARDGIKNALTSLAGGLNIAGDFTKGVNLGAVQDPIGMLKGLLGFGDSNELPETNNGQGGVEGYQGEGGIMDTVEKQQEDFFKDMNSAEQGGNEKAGKGSGGGKGGAGDTAKALKDASEQLKIEKEKELLAKKVLDDQTAQLKEKEKLEVDGIKDKLELLNNAEKLKNINEESLKIDQSKSDVLKDQLELLQRQKALNTDKNIEAQLNAQILAKKDEIKAQEDKEKADYELKKKKREDEDKAYKLQAFELEKQIKAKEDDYEKQLAQLGKQKENINLGLINNQGQKIDLDITRYLNDQKRNKPSYGQNISNQSSIINNNQNNSTNQTFQNFGNAKPIFMSNQFQLI